MGMGDLVSEAAVKPCPSYPGYSVTESGEVFTHRRRFGLGKGRGGGVRIDGEYARKLGSWTGHGGYQYVSVATPRGQRAVPVHALLMDAFVGPAPDGQEVRHLDGTTNNALSNLAYGTPKQNAEDRLRCGVRMEGESHPRAKLTEADVRDIRSRAASGESLRQMARARGLGLTTVKDIVSRRRWSHV